MPNLEERLQAVVSQSETDSSKWHTIVHGDDTTTIPTENGNVPSVAKQLKDVRAEIINGLEDYVGDCRQAKADTLQIKSETQIIKNETNTLKGQTKTLRDEAETFKELSQTTYNSIASATAASISQVQSEGAVQVALATAQAERALAYAQNAAPTPLGTKLTVPASSKVPDGYEPVWYKNTITRARYPDFFTQLVDTNSLVLVDEETYDSQVATYGMCASYVKVDNNSILRPRVSYLEKIDTKNTMVYFVDALGVEYLSFILAQCNSNNLFANVTVCRSELPSITCMNKEFVDVFSSAGCKIIDIKDLDELKHHGTNDFDYQITKEPIHLIEELNIIATVLEKIRTNIASGKCEKAIIISDHGASRLAVINETENKYEMSEKGEHSGRCCPVSDIDEKPDFATEENGYWVLANYDRFKGGRKANVEVHGGAALEEVCVPIIEITPQNEKIDVRLLDSYKNITVSFRKSALIKFFINKKLNNLKVKIEGKYYDAQPTAEEFVYQVSMPDIRKAKNYIFDVYASENMIASGLQFNVKSEVTVEKDLF